MHLEALSEETRAVRDRVMKAQMEALTISYGKDGGSGAASISNSDSFGNSNAYSTGQWIRSLPRDDVLFPAKFLPTPVGIEYSSHAARAFHATTTTAHSPHFMDRAPSPPNMRWTQPPSVFAMRELDLVPLHPGETGHDFAHSLDQFTHFCL
jgi:hypothetical protein